MGGVICLVVILIFFTGCQEKTQNSERLYRVYCGGCHTLPDPEDLPKSIWKEKIIPEMGARLGVRVHDYDPYKGLSFEERKQLIMAGTYPKKALISDKHWKAVTDYILSHAPDSLPVEKRTGRSDILTQFSSAGMNIDGNGALITFVGFSSPGHFFIGDSYGQLWQVNKQLKSRLMHIGENPVVDFSIIRNRNFITEIGMMQPSQIKSGKLSCKNAESGTFQLVADSLHRPVKTMVTDINDDGQDEIIVSEFGDKTGGLTLMTKDSLGAYLREKLLNAAGITHFMLRDMNEDSLKDIVAVAGQESEGVYILYQKPGLNFAWKRVISFSPVYGTSWMDLADYNSDGYPDIFVVQGDNADFSMVSKPYHGLRIYINDGKNNFQQKYFYPLYGATRVIARDFDQDHDIDIAISSFFPDYDLAPDESFVYLENQDSEKFRFRSYTFPDATSGRWLTMASGDYDDDGDIDLVLGSFTYAVTPVPREYEVTWNQNNVDVIVLKNNLIEVKNE